MADRAKNKLTVTAIKAAKSGKLQDGGGLVLVKQGTSGKWIYRYSHLGRRREMGIGSLDTTTLAAARKERDRWAVVLSGGLDPIAERRAENAARVAERDRNNPTFATMAQITLEAKAANLRREGASGRWLSPLRVHMFPVIGQKNMADIRATDLQAAMAPIWRAKAPTADKCFERTRMVFRHAQLSGIDCTTETVEAARVMLGEYRHTAVSIAATPWQDIPDLFARLGGHSASRQCLRWMILTAVRSDGCLGARFDEIVDGVWTVPAERVKGTEGRAQPFRVPLSRAALDIVEEASKYHAELLFPGARGHKPITNRATQKMLDDLGEVGRPHGFRTSIRTWIQDTDACSWEVSETILGHTVGSKVERAYARSDLLERRRPVMESWARYASGEAQNVVGIAGT